MQIHGYDMPDDLYYDEHHFWIRSEGDILVMGMNDFAQQLAGQVVYVQLPFDGKAPASGPVVMEDFDDSWPGYEEPVITPRSFLSSLPTKSARKCPRERPRQVQP